MRLRLVLACSVLALASAGALAESVGVATTGSLAPAAAAPSGDKAAARAAMVRDALFAYDKGDLAAGDASAAQIDDASARLALEWAALRENGRKAGFQRINAFLAAHPGFPMTRWLRNRAEEALFTERRDTATVRAFFKGDAPETAAGKVSLALAERAQGDKAAAIRLVRSAWRDNRLPQDIARFITTEFPQAVAVPDSLYRALRQLYAGNEAEGLRFAEMAGPDELALGKALAASIDARKNAATLLEAVPARLRKNPAYLFAQAQLLRRQDKLAEAAAVLQQAPTDVDALIAPESWWDERRLLARKLLDAKQPALAYAVVDRATPASDADRVEAAFHAGWIALRYLGQPAVARRHFEIADDAAHTPVSLARANYWLGRAAEAGGGGSTIAAYEDAARYSTTYYGQLAMRKLGRERLSLPAVPNDASARHAFSSTEIAGAIRTLFEAGSASLAAPLVIDLARTLPDASALDALGDLLQDRHQPRLSVVVGKLALQRGFVLTQHAYPIQGVPDFEPLDGSAGRPMVYAVARQESEFNAEAVSHAGARGLMQMMPATAKRTAQAFHVDYDAKRLTSDPAYNARLGAAHLGQLLREQSGSHILTFAAYNAGGRRVKEWIAAHGDPRRAGVDPIDWVERIPFSETRNYVQRVMENLQVYRARFGEQQARLQQTDDTTATAK